MKHQSGIAMKTLIISSIQGGGVSSSIKGLSFIKNKLFAQDLDFVILASCQLAHVSR